MDTNLVVEFGITALAPCNHRYTRSNVFALVAMVALKHDTLHVSLLHGAFREHVGQNFYGGSAPELVSNRSRECFSSRPHHL